MISIVILCCGSRTRTCGLKAMILASYQLLYSAILKTRRFGLIVNHEKHKSTNLLTTLTGTILHKYT